MVYEAASSAPIVRLEVRLEGNGEPPIVYLFEPGVGADGRFNRRIGPKLTTNGTFPLVLTAFDTLGRSGSARCAPGVTVTF